jgi:molybdenum cofactor guanylyltransferase
VIEDCTAIILAGGDSQRVRSDKANLLLDGQTLLQRVIASMQQVFPHVIVSVRQRRTNIDLPQVCDEHLDVGPLAGLVAGLGRVSTPWAFAVACDMPFIEPAWVEWLGKYRSAHQAVVPVVQGHPQPLAAFYAGDCLAMLKESLSKPDKSLRGALKLLDVCYVEEKAMLEANHPLRGLLDLDTPQDFEKASHGE